MELAVIISNENPEKFVILSNEKNKNRRSEIANSFETKDGVLNENDFQLCASLPSFSKFDGEPSWESVGRNCLINPTENKIKSFADKRFFENNGLLKSVNLKNLCNFLGEFKKSSYDNYIGIEQGRFTNGRTSEGLYLSIPDIRIINCAIDVLVKKN